AFLDACDRLGMMVIDEAFDMWREGKNPDDYHLYFDEWWRRDVESMVWRDRNHPSVIMWSIGNEIPSRAKPEVVSTAKALGDYIGEASIGWRGYWQEKNFYPWTLAYCGDIDICGWKRPQSYYRDALWKSDQVSIFVRPPRPTFPPNPKRQPWSKWHWYDAVAG